MEHSNHPLFLWHRVHRAQRKALNAELAAAGYGEIGHPMLLSILKFSGRGHQEEAGYSQQELAKWMNTSPAAVAVSLKSLEKGGYIARHRTEDDARRNRVVLTEKGRDAVTGCQDCFHRIDARMFDGFSPEEIQQLNHFMSRMLENIQPEDAPPQTNPQERTDDHCSNCF